ncbi:hypothetical protein AAG596_05945 [Citromicrobium bathyomarinum]|uniref:hypothetical protein n=1 Tax=Citromicrobium TaxID=72173 RepID=UPI000225DD96|nr:hypothetical protein [Citromicrobium sp. JLT1363]
MSDLAPQADLAPPHPLDAGSTLVEQWGAVEDAARVLAMLAGRPTPVHDVHAEARIGLLAAVQGTRGDAAIFALAELVATMRAGLDALLAAHGTSANPHAAAIRLWNEYERGRAQVLGEAATALAC